MVDVWSNGLGTQSMAIAVLVAQGRLPKPDLIVAADTGREATSSWRYAVKYMLPLLQSVGLTIHIAPHDLATVDIYSKKGDLLIPAYTATGKLPTFCSNEWKTRVVRRYIRSLGVERCQMWLGMSIDEIERLKHSDVQWIENHWPLCFDVPMSRAECYQLVTDQGYPPPPKSACKICPHLTNDRWQEMKINEPEDFAEAITFDQSIRVNDQRGGVWLHSERKPLDQIDFAKPDLQPSLFGCDSGFCWT